MENDSIVFGIDKDLMFFGVDPAIIPTCWEKVKPGISNAIKYADGKYTVSDIETALLSLDMQLWLVVHKSRNIRALFVTQIVQYPGKKVMLFVLIQGIKFEEWQHFIVNFKDFAKSHNCQAIEGYGRPGWEPKIISMGFKKVHTVYSLPI